MEFSSRHIQFLDFSVLILSCVLFQFLDMNSLQASLPNDHLQSSFYDESQAWFPQNPMSGMPNIPAAAEGRLFSASKVTFPSPFCFDPATIANQGCIFF